MEITFQTQEERLQAPPPPSSTHTGRGKVPLSAAASLTYRYVGNGERCCAEVGLSGPLHPSQYPNLRVDTNPPE